VEHFETKTQKTMSDPEPNFVIANAIKADKKRMFNEHPRAVSFRWNSKWYQGIRTAEIPEGLDMDEWGFSPDTDTVLRILFVDFKGADGNGVVPPVINDRIRMENINWRVEMRTMRADDAIYVLRKESKAS
jgi:hypothetical protein